MVARADTGQEREVALVDVAIRRLPKRQRTVVVLRYFEDLSERQVADVLGCSVGTVKSQASRALAKLATDTALRKGDPQ